MKIGVLIPTRGDRPEFLEQAKRMLKYQTLRPDKVYIVADPGKPGVYDTDVRTKAGIAAAIRDGIDRLFTWDDDEYYAPTYLDWLNREWPRSAKAVGVRNLPYYHLGYRKAIARDFEGHATNSCTAFVPKAFEYFDVRQDGYMFDVPMWQWIHGNVTWALIRQTSIPYQVIGIKHKVGELTAGAHDWPASMYPLDDAQQHWLKANIHPDMVDFYLEGWNNGREIRQNDGGVDAGAAG